MQIVQSFFIPRVSTDVTKYQLKQYFMKFGMLCRVDFVSFNSENGIGRRAYVHYHWYNFGCIIDSFMNQNGFYDISDQVLGEIRLLKNKNPVPQTSLNLDQVAYNTIFIGDEMKNQQTKTELLEEKVEQLEKMVRLLMSRLPTESSQTSSDEFDDSDANSMAVLIPHCVPIKDSVSVNLVRHFDL
jgi:hypothetical protein